VKRTRLVLAAVLVVGALLYLIIGGIRGAIVYYTTPSELLAQGPGALGRSLRLGGQVAPGSKQWNANTLELRFVLTDGTASVPVVHRGAPPDLFTEGQGAVVEGTYGADGVFVARAVIVKHSEEYAPPPVSP
jgi:cytochrome c-type biogenesis protein CcmE